MTFGQIPTVFHLAKQAMYVAKAALILSSQHTVTWAKGLIVTIINTKRLKMGIAAVKRAKQISIYLY
ncbi:hypothetical protein GCM10007414_38450 [Agarivorans gilvus]|uniref:Uncharacterized protein n=1 Tax=Agarivorans gilvus TaxID=680279 RepID=A0ABQ1I8E5_9ALTE|nr:hypothetical protein GCM10007414_38450 [Agarivorans gilvus]